VALLQAADLIERVEENLRLWETVTTRVPDNG